MQKYVDMLWRLADKINAQHFTLSVRFVLIPFPIPHSPLRSNIHMRWLLFLLRFFLTQYSLDVMSDKSNSRSRKFRVLSSGSPLGYVNCIVTESVLFEQMTTMLMFTLLTFTNVDVNK
jgi:hypothetical protein